MAANKIFSRTVFDIDIYGEKFKVKKPSGIIKQKYITAIEEINSKLDSKEEIDKNTDYNITVAFLEELGIPENVFKEMEDEHQLELILMLLSEKKS